MGKPDYSLATGSMYLESAICCVIKEGVDISIIPLILWIMVITITRHIHNLYVQNYYNVYITCIIIWHEQEQTINFLV